MAGSLAFGLVRWRSLPATRTTWRGWRSRGEARASIATPVEAMRRDERLRSLPLMVYTGSQLTTADRHRLLLGETRFVIKSGESSADFAPKVMSLLRKVTTDS